MIWRKSASNFQHWPARARSRPGGRAVVFAAGLCALAAAGPAIAQSQQPAATAAATTIIEQPVGMTVVNQPLNELLTSFSILVFSSYNVSNVSTPSLLAGVDTDEKEKKNRNDDFAYYSYEVGDDNREDSGFIPASNRIRGNKYMFPVLILLNFN